jgi:hypothetical protein
MGSSVRTPSTAEGRDPGPQVETAPTSRLAWTTIVAHAAGIVDGYDTGVTLRQLFYRLVADGTLPNTTAAYKTLSRRTAEARRRGYFPSLIDRGRTIHGHSRFESPEHALDWLTDTYRRDRTEGQPWTICLGIEKNAIVEQLVSWFGDLGVPVLALGGYSSQTYVDEVVAHVRAQDRPAVLLYGGDFDPSGEDIDRDFIARSGVFQEVVRVALSAEQVTAYGLPPAPGKASDSRASAFVRRHGRLVQVEVDALPPDVLRGLYQSALDQVWDPSAYTAVLAQEAVDREHLRALLP